MLSVKVFNALHSPLLQHFYHTVQSIRRRSISPTGLGELCEPGTGAYSPLQCFVPGQVPGAEWRREDGSNSSNTQNTPRLSEIVGMGGQLYYIFLLLHTVANI